MAYFFVGLQAGSLATRAISHLHVTKENYLKWLLTEIKVAAILGLGMGLLIGLIAFQASGFDYGFGFVIFVAILSPGASGVAAANCAWSGPSTLSFRYCKRFCTSTRIGDGAITTVGNAVGKPQQQNRRETSSM